MVTGQSVKEQRGDGRRPKRVAESVRTYLSQVLFTEVADPRLKALVVTRVEMSADLGIAFVYVRVMAGEDDDAARDSAVRAIQRVGGRFQRGLGRQLRMRRTPELRFRYDDTPEVRGRISELLDEVKRDQAL